MLSDLAMPVGRTGRISSVPPCIATAIGLHPADCAPNTRHPPGGATARPISTSSVNALSILVSSSPLAIGTTICSGNRQPSCSATSYPRVLEPSA
jgi:hypothetical protein